MYTFNLMQKNLLMRIADSGGIINQGRRDPRACHLGCSKRLLKTVSKIYGIEILVGLLFNYAMQGGKNEIDVLLNFRIRTGAAGCQRRKSWQHAIHHMF
jgi:hypothetical protein